LSSPATNLRNAALLVAAMVGTALCIGFSSPKFRIMAPAETSLFVYSCLKAYLFALLIAPCIAAWTLTVFVLQITSRRCRARRLLSEPGATAGFVWLVLTGLKGSVVILAALLAANATTHEIGLGGWTPRMDIFIQEVKPWSPAHHWPECLAHTFTSSALESGWAIAAAWFLIAVSRRWRRPTDWLERAARTAAWYWIALAVVVGLYDCHFAA
jgi:hypothetical protein